MPEKPIFDWTENLQQYQRAYFNTWQSFIDDNKSASGGKTKAENGASNNPWMDAMNNWWQAVSEQSSEPVNEFYERFVDQGKAFLQMSDEFSSAFQKAQDGSSGAAPQWQEFIEFATQNFQNVFSNSAWQMPLSNWQHVMSSMSFLPGNPFEGIDIMGQDFVKDNLRDNLDKMLSTPGVGQNREKQEQQQRLLKLILEYQSAMQEYAEAQAEIGVLSVRKFQERLTQIAQSDDAQALGSFKDVYDCWVDCCEEVYAEYVMSEKYISTHGKVVNTLMAVKQQGRMMVDEVLGAFNMPTRREIDTLHSRFHQVWRDEKGWVKEFAAFKQEVAALIEAQAKQIASLQKQIETLKAKPTSSRAPAKAVAKKTTTAKQSTATKRTTRKTKSNKSATGTKGVQ